MKRTLESNDKHQQSIKANRVSLVHRAAKRFSGGGKMPTNNRITIDMSEYVNFEPQKEEIVENLGKLK